MCFHCRGSPISVTRLNGRNRALAGRDSGLPHPAVINFAKCSKQPVASQGTAGSPLPPPPPPTLIPIPESLTNEFSVREARKFSGVLPAVDAAETALNPSKRDRLFCRYRKWMRRTVSLKTRIPQVFAARPFTRKGAQLRINKTSLTTAAYRTRAESNYCWKWRA